VISAGARASVNYLRHSEIERKMHKERTWELLTKLVEADLPVMLSESHIIPLFIGDPFKCK
jgi:5-aminolevulinate synthase